MKIVFSSLIHHQRSSIYNLSRTLRTCSVTLALNVRLFVALTILSTFCFSRDVTNISPRFVSLSLFLHSTAAAFAPQAGTTTSTALNAEAGRREFFSKAAAATAAVVGAAAPANAVIDYENIGYLGGSNIIDVNNANVRAYLKLPGMYPTVAGKVVTNGPYASVADLYKIPGLSSKESEVLKKYESRFVAKKPSPDYVIDRVNNGL